MAPFHYHSMFGNEGERPLLQVELGAFLYASIGLLGRTAKGREYRDIGIEPQPVIAPIAGGNHPSVKVEDALQFGSLKCRNSSPIPRMRKRRDNAQALLTFGAG